MLLPITYAVNGIVYVKIGLSVLKPSGCDVHGIGWQKQGVIAVAIINAPVENPLAVENKADPRPVVWHSPISKVVVEVISTLV